MMRFVRNFALFLIFLMFSLGFFSPVFAKEKPYLLFNAQPFNRDNIKYSGKNFTKGQRVYYLFISPKTIDSEYIRVQVFKVSDNGPAGGYEMIMVNDYRLPKGENHYYTDYVVLNQNGHYVMQIFIRNKFKVLNASRPAVLSDFFVH